MKVRLTSTLKDLHAFRNIYGQAKVQIQVLIYQDLSSERLKYI